MEVVFLSEVRKITSVSIVYSFEHGNQGGERRKLAAARMLACALHIYVHASPQAQIGHDDAVMLPRNQRATDEDDAAARISD